MRCRAVAKSDSFVMAAMVMDMSVERLEPTPHPDPEGRLSEGDANPQRSSLPVSVEFKAWYPK
jgi:hypothetical protein